MIGKEKRELGVMAQDVLPVFPEAVSMTDNQYFGVSYVSLIPVLIEAIKEQQKIIEALREENQTLIPEAANDIADIKAALNGISKK